MNIYKYYLSVIKFAFNLFKFNIYNKKKYFKLTLSLTNKCNSKCKTCGIWKIKEKRDISFEEIDKFFKNNDLNWIDLTGGEVFMRNDLIEIIKLIKETQKNLFLLHIPTNGILADKIEEKVKEIIGYNFPKFLLTISLDGSESVHNNIRGINNNWKKSVELYKKLKIMKSKNFDCFFGMTISALNSDNVDLMYKDLKKEIPLLKKSDIHYNLAHNSSSYYKNENEVLVDEEVSEVFKQIYKQNKFSFNPVKILERIYQKNVLSYLKFKKYPLNNCKAGKISIFINEQGDIYPCTMWDNKITTLKDIDYNLKNLTYTFDNKKCSQCWTPCEAYQNILVIRK